MNDSIAPEPAATSPVALDNISIVLINTTHPGNIGSAARAMKTMGLSRLILVEPADFPSDHASALASGGRRHSCQCQGG